MSAANEAWIQDSLARLEQLEAHRQRLAATGRPDELAEIDEEIKSLYEVLEAAAAEEATAANQMPASAVAQAAWGEVPHPAFGPAPGMSPAAAVAAPIASPFESPFAAPAAAMPAAAPSFAPASFESSVMMDDEPKKGSGAILAVAVLALFAGGGAGWWFLARPKPVEMPPPAAPTEVQVFKAGAIPEDTQEPQVAKGGDADRTPTVTLKVPDDNDRRPRASSSNNSRPAPRPEPEPAAGKKIKVDASSDPLAGVK
jgi:hypothetical protein